MLLFLIYLKKCVAERDISFICFIGAHALTCDNNSHSAALRVILWGYNEPTGNTHIKTKLEKPLPQSPQHFKLKREKRGEEERKRGDSRASPHKFQPHDLSIVLIVKRNVSFKRYNWLFKTVTLNMLVLQKHRPCLNFFLY